LPCSNASKICSITKFETSTTKKGGGGGRKGPWGLNLARNERTEKTPCSLYWKKGPKPGGGGGKRETTLRSSPLGGGVKKDAAWPHYHEKCQEGRGGRRAPAANRPELFQKRKEGKSAGRWPNAGPEGGGGKKRIPIGLKKKSVLP